MKTNNKIAHILLILLIGGIGVQTFTACGEHSWDQANLVEGGTSGESEGTAIVGPLLKTQWGRGSPYNPFQTLSDGSSGWVDCVTIATSQIMNYHRYPSQAIAGAPYQGIVFDWDNMLDSYKNVNLTEQQKKAINDLEHSLHLGLQTGAGRSFVNNFGYDKTFETHYRRYYDDATWVAEFSAIIKKQLDAGLPILAHGSNLAGTSSHGFVIDGYNDKDRFHINWGWGGSYDGYFPIDSLAPGRALEDGWHHVNNFKIFINIQPDKGGIGTNTMALDSFTVGKTAVGQKELFSIKARIHRFGIFPGGQVGAALVGNNGSIAKVIGARSFTTSYNMDAFVPDDVNPGQYKLQMVTRFEGGEWKLITLSDRTANIPSAINITVKAAEPGTSSGGYSSSSARQSSSSSARQSSSSSKPSSSSSVYEIIHGTPVTYEGEIYETVVIGTQTWMTRNLNYAVEGSKCYRNDLANCEKYGRLYDWATAMALQPICNNTTCSSQIQQKHRGICPSGWHIPSKENWYALIAAIGGNSTTKWKARSGWNPYEGIPAGTDDFGFAALPGGFGNSEGFGNVGNYGYWWSTAEDDIYANHAYNWFMLYREENLYWVNKDKDYFFSVRCLKDN